MKSGIRNGAASCYEDQKSCAAVCLSSRNLEGNHRSKLKSGDSESEQGMGEFMEVVERALNMQTASQGLGGKRKADLFKSMETPLNRKPQITEGEKLKKEGKSGRKDFEFTGIKGKESKSFASTPFLAVQLEEVERLKASLARRLTSDWSHRRGILSRKRLNFDEFEKTETQRNLKHPKLTSQDVEIVDLEGDAIDDETVKEEVSRTDGDVIAELYQTSKDDPEILEIREKEVKITSNGDKYEDCHSDDDVALQQGNSFKSPQLSDDIITLDEEEEVAEHDKGEEANGKMQLQKEIIELEEISFTSPIPKSYDNRTSDFFAVENNDFKATFKRSVAATQIDYDDEPPFKTLKMSKPTTLDENEDVIELD